MSVERMYQGYELSEDGANTLAEMLNTDEAELTLVKIADALKDQIVGDSIWDYTHEEIATSANGILDRVVSALLDYRDGWAFEAAEGK